jgi:hypothetical protein
MSRADHHRSGAAADVKSPINSKIARVRTDDTSPLWARHTWDCRGKVTAVGLRRTSAARGPLIGRMRFRLGDSFGWRLVVKNAWLRLCKLW